MYKLVKIYLNRKQTYTFYEVPSKVLPSIFHYHVDEMAVNNMKYKL